MKQVRRTSYGGLTYTGNNWYLAGIAYWDSSEGSGAYKFRADYDFGNGFKFGGGYLWDDGETDYVKGHAWFVTSQYQLTENMLLFGGYGQYADQWDQRDSDVWCDDNGLCGSSDNS